MAFESRKHFKSTNMLEAENRDIRVPRGLLRVRILDRRLMINLRKRKKNMFFLLLLFGHSQAKKRILAVPVRNFEFLSQKYAKSDICAQKQRNKNMSFLVSYFGHSEVRKQT